MPDPSKVRVQFNVQVPWLFKEFIADKAQTDRVSQNQLALDAFLQAYGTEYDLYEQSYLRQQSVVTRQQTRDAGATS